MKHLQILSALLATLTFSVWAQPPAAAAPSSVCEVYFTAEAEVDGHDAGDATGRIPAQPIDDVLFQSEAFQKVLNLASMLAEKAKKGDPSYTLILTEDRICDGGPSARARGGEFRGLTLQAMNQIARAMQQQTGLVTGRYEGKAAKGAKTAWDHTKAPKVERDDLGRRKHIDRRSEKDKPAPDTPPKKTS